MIHFQNDTLCRRLFLRVVIDQESGCWNFTGSRRLGYGRIQNKGANLTTHRVAWEMWNGPVPAGYQLHHECRNEACCNPEHLTPVTPRTHAVDLTPGHIAARNASKTHCPKGHPLVKGNLNRAVLREGRRRCLICTRESGKRNQRRYMARKTAARLASGG